MEVVVGIVTYNPDLHRLQSNILAIKGQVKSIIIIDNGSNNISDIKSRFSNDARIHSNDRNMGIAYALNQIMAYSIKQNCKWTLLLDQDSICPSDIISKFERMLPLDDAGILCPKVFDNNTNEETLSTGSIERIGICITSGSLNSNSVWKSIGKFDEKLFIDSVDNEYCIRLFFSGYKIYRNNNVLLNHELGKSEKHLIKRTTNHNATRRYYIARNSIYVAKKYELVAKEHGYTGKDYRQVNDFLDQLINPLRIYMRQLQFVLLVTLYEKDKIAKIKAIIKGLLDGNKMIVAEQEKEES